MNDKLILVLIFFLISIGKVAVNAERKIGKLHNFNWEEYYNLGSNFGTYSVGKSYPDYSCVGALLSKDGILGTGTLISPNVLVTAAHVLRNSLSTPLPDAGHWEFILHPEYKFTPENSIYQVEKILIHPAWNKRLKKQGGPGDGDILGVDLALVFLKKDVVGVYPAKLNYGNIETLGDKVFLAGFGSLADGFSGVLNQDNLKRVGGVNSLDRVVVKVNAPEVDESERGGLLAIDFDSPLQNTNSLGGNAPLVDYLGYGTSNPTPLDLEAGTVVGDSGGPVFIMIDGAWRTIGTVSYGTSDSTYGDITVYTRLASHVEWIQSYLPNWSQGKKKSFNNWIELDWFGPFFNAVNNWNYHSTHGWFYTQYSSGESFWSWQSNHLGWWWTSRSVYPFVYSFSLGRWLYIDIEKSDFNKLVYYDYEVKNWKAILGSS